MKKHFVLGSIQINNKRKIIKKKKVSIGFFFLIVFIAFLVLSIFSPGILERLGDLLYKVSPATPLSFVFLAIIFVLSYYLTRYPTINREKNKIYELLLLGIIVSVLTGYTTQVILKDNMDLFDKLIKGNLFFTIQRYLLTYDNAILGLEVNDQMQRIEKIKSGENISMGTENVKYKFRDYIFALKEVDAIIIMKYDNWTRNNNSLNNLLKYFDYFISQKGKVAKIILFLDEKDKEETIKYFQHNFQKYIVIVKDNKLIILSKLLNDLMRRHYHSLLGMIKGNNGEVIFILSPFDQEGSEFTGQFYFNPYNKTYLQYKGLFEEVENIGNN